jgi:hypothetical protein
MIYHHEARGADQAITNALDTQIQRRSPAMMTTSARRACSLSVG